MSGIGHSSGGSVGAAVVVKKAVCGDLFTLLLTTSGEVYGCGNSAYLGNAATPTTATGKTTTAWDVSYNVTTATRVEALLGSLVTDVCAGAAHALALTRAGELYSWGANQYCQLGYACANNTGECGINY